jgi:DNA replication protein DnaC
MKNPYIIKEVNGEEYYVPNKEYWDKVTEKRYNLLLKKSKIPQNYWDIEFEDYKGKRSVEEKDKAVVYSKKCREEKFHNINLYLVGENGTQKTMIACNIGKEFIKNGFRVYFTYASELIDLLLKMQGYSWDKELYAKLKDIESYDLLIIDDIFDTQKGIYWKNNPDLVISAWDQFLRRFISEDKRLILTSNEPISTIKDNFGQSMYNLIYRNFEELMFHDYIGDVRKGRFKDLWRENNE